MLNYTGGSDEEIENKLSLLSPSFQKPFVQMMWKRHGVKSTFDP